VASEGPDLRADANRSVRLIDVDPDFIRSTPEDERDHARGISLPAIDVPHGAFDPTAVLSAAGGSYGILLEGMLNRSVHIGAHVALRVLGPSAVVPGIDGPPSTFVNSQWLMATPGRLAVVGEEFFHASRRWPQLYLNLLARINEQTEQLVTQLTLCQLPRVEDRVLAMLWLLSESWGKVTSAGTVLPLHFTHEALGAMVGARRSTVTLALGKLTETGAVVERDSGWLLLERPPQTTEGLAPTEPPRLLDLSPTGWTAMEDPTARLGDEREALFALIARMRAEHRRSVKELGERLRRSQLIRDRAIELRSRLHHERELARQEIRLEP
jgi:hypothetical protein